jgi:FlaA1/EpsC-like NDP-sugar epimerase
MRPSEKLPRRFRFPIAIALLIAGASSPAWTSPLEPPAPDRKSNSARTMIQSSEANAVDRAVVQTTDNGDEEKNGRANAGANHEKNDDGSDGKQPMGENEGATQASPPLPGRAVGVAADANRVPCFCAQHLAHSLLQDQKAIWTSPLRLRARDLYWLAPAAMGTAGLVLADNAILRHFGGAPMAHSNTFSNYGLAALIGGGAGIYLSGVITHDDHRRETGLLAGEAAVNAVIVAEAMKAAFERPRPNAPNAGNFGAGGASFPSEHALAAWSIATVIAHEYPGPLTKLLAYGAAAGISDSLDVLKAVLTGSFAFFLIVRYGLQLNAFPLSIYVLEAIITFTLLAGVRVLSRMAVETVRPDSSSKRLLLVGAGHAAQAIIRETRLENRPENNGALRNQEVPNKEVQNKNEAGYQVIGCVDDDPLKKGLRIMGVPVFGQVKDLGKFVVSERIDEVLIAIPSATPAQMRRLVAICKEAGAAFRTVPAMSELIAGRVILQQVREVSLTDLLGRIPVDLDLESVREHIQGRVVMVTGAAGSIGSELCRQIRMFKPKLLVCLDQNETGIFHLQHQSGEPRKARGVEAGSGSGSEQKSQRKEDHDEDNAGREVFCVADFCNAERMRRIFLTYGVEIVFHAAAYKHVPVMESNVEEAVSNNIHGLLALLNVAQNSNCSAFVMISSDKAVNPTNVMGCTKRVGELILAAWPGEGLRCVSVRFGNVLGSNGSVIPLFQEQIRQNLPITVTHPDITRFFMTVTEAVSLVLQAFAIGRKGDILVLDMGEPVRVLDLAKTLARLSGKSRPEFKFIGLRPGEKLFEELFYPTERVLPSACAKIACAEGAKLGWPALKRNLDELYVALSLGQTESMLARLRQIVPQFSYPGCDQAATLADAVGLDTPEIGALETGALKMGALEIGSGFEIGGLEIGRELDRPGLSEENVNTMLSPYRSWPSGSRWRTAVDGSVGDRYER